MDLKGISWVGNFYQKFEAMCLEVEETMYEDTVKYVENQVQTVGSSVKRFYSDVMQDLLPPSSMDATKDGDSNLSLDFYGDFGIYMKPKIGTKEKKPKTGDTKKVTEDQIKTANHNSDYALNFPSLSNKSNLRTRKSSKRENSTLKEKSGSVSCLDENINRILPSNENCQQRQYSAQNVEGQKLDEVSKLGNRLCKDLNRASPVNENCKSFHQGSETTTPRFDEVARTNYIQDSQTETPVVRKKAADIPADGPSSNDISYSLVEENAASMCKNDGAISQVESSSNWQVRTGEIDREEDILFSSGSSNGWNTEEVEADTSFLSVTEIVQQPDKANLDESCIVVNRDDIHFAPPLEVKSNSYKKKISNVFSPRKTSSRKQEYQQLALWPTVEDSKVEDGKRFRNPDESEWEIL